LVFIDFPGKGYKPAYNAQATVCGKNGFIVGPGITPEELKENFRKDTHLADHSYDSVDNAVYATEKGLDTYIAHRTTADAGYTLPVVTAGEEVHSNSLDPFEATLSECIGILLIIAAAEIGKMMLEDLMESISSPRKVLWLLFFLYRSILYTHI
jgi:hypothetical protein